tara:strand:- start:54 stop:173 length:120 start_codon:yes stop_codon:yes gene_type:complete
MILIYLVKIVKIDQSMIIDIVFLARRGNGVEKPELSLFI